ncbi:uncharacterized protein LOC143027827 isoform X4 [Oratosquilla oratoria]|uniref:uncharacterized protein LOC143027827 isoform X4 n=1 Tax=Oratosquilla oratoria TaxID=337810 RepID=UPI003F76FA2D
MSVQKENSVMKQLWSLRSEDPTQYYTLVKMHLSFATDLSTDQCDGLMEEKVESPSGKSSGRWNLTPLIRRLGRPMGNAWRGVMEGAPLTQEGVCQAYQLIHYLNRDYNITQEGLFRKSGSVTRQQELKALLNSGRDLNLDYGNYSAHDCASVLKNFLADLPEPLLSESHYKIHCKIAEMNQSTLDEEKKEFVQKRQIKALRLLFLLLPHENYRLLKDLLMLLNRVTKHQDQNKMTSINLGTMFAPPILCPRKMTPNDLQYMSGSLSHSVAFMIDHCAKLFQIPIELEYDVRQYWSNKKTLKHQLSKRSMQDAPTNTIFTFIDRELTAQANNQDVTDVALAELYAYVQSLPDSAKKRRLIKQFNKENGPGTPHLNNSVQKKSDIRVKSLGDSIKRVIMTPRSRIPIIFNSSSSLSGVPIPENLPKAKDTADSPVIPNPCASMDSPARNTRAHHSRSSLQSPSVSVPSLPSVSQNPAVHTEETQMTFSDDSTSVNSSLAKSFKANSMSTLRRTLSSASSTGSLFGSFFKHLSTSSLAVLASRLTSTSSLSAAATADPEDLHEESLHVEDDENEEANESLSSVFKDYLINRSILTDKPVDLSADCLHESFDGDEENQPPREMPDALEDSRDSACVVSSSSSTLASQQVSKASLASFDSAISVNQLREPLSESLLYCLDGNYPDPNVCLSKREEQSGPKSAILQDQNKIDQHEVAGLHSCSPNGRQHSLLQNKQGTPVPVLEKDWQESHNSNQGVLFETSF